MMAFFKNMTKSFLFLGISFVSIAASAQQTIFVNLKFKNMHPPNEYTTKIPLFQSYKKEFPIINVQGLHITLLHGSITCATDEVIVANNIKNKLHQYLNQKNFSQENLVLNFNLDYFKQNKGDRDYIVYSVDENGKIILNNLRKDLVNIIYKNKNFIKNNCTVSFNRFTSSDESFNPHLTILKHSNRGIDDPITIGDINLLKRKHDLYRMSFSIFFKLKNSLKQFSDIFSDASLYKKLHVIKSEQDLKQEDKEFIKQIYLDHENKSVHKNAAKKILEDSKQLYASIKKIYSDEGKDEFHNLYLEMINQDDMKNLILNISDFQPSVQNVK